MPATSRHWITRAVLFAVVALVGWIYYQSLVPAIHPDHDHGLENIAGGGFLRVERADGGRRNLVGRPDRVMILFWFQIGSRSSMSELPLVVDYARQVAGDPDIEVNLIAIGDTRDKVVAWAQDHGVPTANLYVDPKSVTVDLIGVRRIPETLIYNPEGRLVHQARGPMNWADPRVRATIAGFKTGGGEHVH